MAKKNKKKIDLMDIEAITSPEHARNMYEKEAKRYERMKKWLWICLGQAGLFVLLMMLSSVSDGVVMDTIINILSIPLFIMMAIGCIPCLKMAFKIISKMAIFGWFLWIFPIDLILAVWFGAMGLIICMLVPAIPTALELKRIKKQVEEAQKYVVMCEAAQNNQ